MDSFARTKKRREMCPWREEIGSVLVIEAGGQHVITMSGHLLAEWNLGDEGGEQGIGMHCVECEDPVVPEAVMSRGLLKEHSYELHETAVHQRIVEKKDRAQRHVINHAEH